MPSRRRRTTCERVLGGVEQHAPGPAHREAAQARGAGGDRDGHVEREKRLAALGLAADDADGLLGPQPLDEPAVLLGPDGEALGGLDRQDAHRRRPAATAFGGSAAGAGTAKTSRKSFSSSCLRLALGGGGEQLSGKVHERAVVAGRVLAQRR